MKTPLRLGATVGLGALLLVGLLASPALAWEWGVSAEAVCEESGTTARVDFTVQSQEQGAEGDVTVVALVGDEPFGEPVSGSFGPGGDTVTGSFSGIPLDAESVVVKALVQWKGQQEPEKDKAHVDLPTDCEAAPTTTTPTTTPPTTEGVLGATSTTEGPQLPFTGANSGPLLLAALALVGGGFVILWAGRLRGRHEAR
jgi:hypothetical protein